MRVWTMMCVEGVTKPVDAYCLCVVAMCGSGKSRVEQRAVGARPSEPVLSQRDNLKLLRGCVDVLV